MNDAFLAVLAGAAVLVLVFFAGALGASSALGSAVLPEVSSSVSAATSARRIFLPPSMLYQPGFVVISGFLPFAASYAASKAFNTSVLSSLLIRDPIRCKHRLRIYIYTYFQLTFQFFAIFLPFFTHKRQNLHKIEG